MKNKNLFVLLLLVSILILAFSSTFLYVKVNNEDKAGEELLIMTSCNPVYIATLNVVGDTEGVKVENLSQPTTGCLHDYTLTAQDMKNLSKADVLVISGGGMEGYLDDVMSAYPKLEIIDASKGIELLAEEEHEEHEDHEHQDEAEEEYHHDHGEVNSHYWLSVSAHIEAVNNIAAELGKLDARNSEAYGANANSYMHAIESELSPELDMLIALMGGDDVAILHEAYEYIASDLDCEVAAVMDLDEERQVSAGEVAELLEEIEEHEIKIVLAEEDYGKQMGDMIEEQTHATVVYLDTLIHGSFNEDDYIKVMLDNYKLILEAI